LAIPFAVAAVQYQQLHKRAGFRIIFPGRSLLTGTQPHDGIAHALGFTGLHGQFFDQAIALVQQAQHSHTICHGGNARDHVRGGSGRIRFFQFHRNCLCALICLSGFGAAASR
jgi:hypothetical protein